MTRWTTNGWDVCLGGGMWKSWWNDQGGLDFVLETKARAACASELIFLQKVYRLQWLAQYYYLEKTEAVRRNGQYDPNNPWYTLSMIQRQLLVNNKTSKQILMFPAHHRGKNQFRANIDVLLRCSNGKQYTRCDNYSCYVMHSKQQHNVDAKLFGWRTIIRQG